MDHLYDVFARLRAVLEDKVGDPAPEAEIAEVEMACRPFLLTSELKELYRSFNGSKDEDSFQTLEEVLESREWYKSEFSELGMIYPSALFSVCTTNYGHLFAIMAKSCQESSPILEWAVSEGDREMTLEYSSLQSFAMTKLKVWNYYRKLTRPQLDQQVLSRLTPTEIQSLSISMCSKRWAQYIIH